MPVARTHVKAGVATAIGASLPLVLYVIFGPKDGNPVGLGLLMMLGWLVGGALVAGGTIRRVFGRSDND